jgi:hypothetical protein
MLSKITKLDGIVSTQFIVPETLGPNLNSPEHDSVGDFEALPKFVWAECSAQVDRLADADT